MRKLRWSSSFVLVICGLLMLNACGDITATPTQPPAVATVVPVAITSATIASTLAITTKLAATTLLTPTTRTPAAPSNTSTKSSPETAVANTTNLVTKPALTSPATATVNPSPVATAAAVPTIIATLALRTTDFKLAEVARSLPIIRAAPAWDNQTWVNSSPLKLADLRGKVVLVEFWTFECINCINVLPAMHQIYDQFGDKGFTIVAFHTPELSVEKDWNNVKAAVKADGIKYPVAQDNDMKTWNAYRVNAWPTWFLIDKSGNIRYKHIGEGAYEETSLDIAALLEETSK